ncbi:MAG TPA: hypothetical protein G4O13_08010 [Dehalococcoidia bacterium]|nr:hypothetical protein [Dehalococcoidia bacterium]
MIYGPALVPLQSFHGPVVPVRHCPVKDWQSEDMVKMNSPASFGEE